MAGPRRPKDFDYQTYLASREWSLLREQVRERSKNTCEHCFRAPQEAVHHLTYERIWHEDIADLMAICNACHEFVSGKSSVNPLHEAYVVTPEFMAKVWRSLGWTTGNHYALPFDPGSGLRVETLMCRGEGCIWCGYVDPDWPIFLNGLMHP